MNTLTDNSTAHARQLRDEFPWIWLYEIEIPTTPKTRYRLTNYTSPVNFGTNSTGRTLTYAPFPIVHSELRQTLDGELPSFQLQVGHASLELAQILEDHRGLKGSEVVVRIVNSSDLSTGVPAFEVVAEVTGCKVTHERVALSIGSKSLVDAVIPPTRYSRTHCGHAYGDAGCGYDLGNPTLLAAFPTCNRQRDGANGCEAHGDAEVDAGLPRLHPENFGADPSIPRG